MRRYWVSGAVVHEASGRLTPTPLLGQDVKMGIRGTQSGGLPSIDTDSTAIRVPVESSIT